jgi:hypothetical protein
LLSANFVQKDVVLEDQGVQVGFDGNFFQRSRQHQLRGTASPYLNLAVVMVDFEDSFGRFEAGEQFVGAAAEFSKVWADNFVGEDCVDGERG